MKKSKENNWVAENVDCPFQDDRFSILWVQLLKMPKWAKKPLSAIMMSCNLLKRYDVDFAATLVECAIQGNWQGVVFPDTAQRYELYKSRINGNNNYGGFRQAAHTEVNATGDFGNL